MFRAIEHDVLVDFIRNRDDVPALTEVGNDRQFVPRKDLAGRVRGRIDDDGPGSIGKGGRQPIAIERPRGWASRTYLGAAPDRTAPGP